jgi:hypothetical protein
VSFLAATMTLPAQLEHLALLPAKLFAAIVFDHLVRHPVVSVGDFDDERLTDEQDRLLDARNPVVEESIDWFFRISRRHEVLWLDLSLDLDRPHPLRLRTRRPAGPIEEWTASGRAPLSDQLAEVLDLWLEARRLPRAGPLDRFDVDEVIDATLRIDRALVASRTGPVPEALLAAPPRLGVPFLRALADLATFDGSWEQRILTLAPGHAVARARRGDPTVIDDAPMYARPYRAIGDLRHQGVAASLAPADPVACHGYALQLAAVGRVEEAFRWCDRATIAEPSYDPAHLECVRLMRRMQRPGQAYAEAGFRCKDVLERADDAETRTAAQQLQAAVHADLAKNDDFHRGEPARAIERLMRAGVRSPDDAWMLIDALIAVGHEELARVAAHHHHRVLGDGKARLAAARAELLGGDAAAALEHLQIVQRRRPQSRLEPEINRILRLAACRHAPEWDAVIAHLLERDPERARRAARDLADFVPGMDLPSVNRALGDRRAWPVDPHWLIALSERLPKLGAAGPALDERLAPPAEPTLAAADLLAQDWWAILPPPNKDRDAHAAAALYALGVALARYLAAASGAPTPTAGAYRHVATEALHLVRRARYHLDDDAERALLELLEGCASRLDPRDEWLFDTWLLRVEHALDLDTEYGAHLPGLVARLPRVAGLLRGDERIGWELRLAEDLRAAGEHDAAGVLLERCARATEAGAIVELAAPRTPLAEAIRGHGDPRLAAAALMREQRHADAVIALRYAMPTFATVEDWRLLAAAAWYAGDAATTALATEQLLAAGAPASPHTLDGLATALYRSGQWAKCEAVARQLLDISGGDATYRSRALHAMARGLAGQGSFGDAARLASEAARLNPHAEAAAEFAETLRLCQAHERPTYDQRGEKGAWARVRLELADSERRGDQEAQVPVAGRALEMAQSVLDRTAGTTDSDACAARIRALRLRESAFIQIDPPPPLVAAAEGRASTSAGVSSPLLARPPAAAR